MRCHVKYPLIVWEKSCDNKSQNHKTPIMNQLIFSCHYLCSTGTLKRLAKHPKWLMSWVTLTKSSSIKHDFSLFTLLFIVTYCG